MRTRQSRHRERFFDKTIHIPKVKDCISGINEKKVLADLEYMGYKINKDFVRQHPIGNSLVVDIAFVREQIAIEVDGQSHKNKKQIELDILRDKFLNWHNWCSIRLPEDIYFGQKHSFFL